MLRIRTMRPEDILAALRLTSHERWGFTARDLMRMLALSARACLVADLDERLVGLATTISYGKNLGWIGNIVVQENRRGAGIGSSLVEAAVTRLLRLRVKSIGLNCYPENEPLYNTLNFKQTSGFVTLSITSGRRRQRVSHGKVPIRQILKLDREAFCADRSALLRRLLKEFPRGWAWIGNESEVLAYSIIKEYLDSSEIGPSVCKGMDRENAATLLQSSISLARKSPLEISVPSSNLIASETAARLGFRSKRSGLIMSYRKLDDVTVSPDIIALGFLDKG